jgi:RNA polymerase sigma-70 factor (ECF subfamily)
MGRGESDIHGSMGLRLEPQAAQAAPGGSVRARGRGLAPEDFSARLSQSSRTLWLIAAGVLGDRADADDVLQDAAMIGLRKLEEFDPATSFAAWMGEIVRNVARNAARKRTRRQTSPADPRTIDQSRRMAAAAAGTPGFDRRGRIEADQAVFDDRVLAALGTLEETARTCLLLRTLQDLPYRDISALLGIPEGTAMSHVHRARQTLRKELTVGATKP